MYCKTTLEASKKKALSLGYKPYPDPKAFLGISFRNKNHKKWILISPSHLLDDPGIKAKNIVDEEDLERLGYNVEDYYNHHPDSIEYYASLRREIDENDFYASERRHSINEIYGNLNIDSDDVDDDFEQLNQLGYNYTTLQKDKDDDFEETNEVTNLEENVDVDETSNADSYPKIYAWHAPIERKKMKHIYKS